MSRGIRLIIDTQNNGKVQDTVQKTVTDPVTQQPLIVDVLRTVHSDPTSDIDQVVMTGSPGGTEGGAVVRPIPWTGSGVGTFQVNPGVNASPLQALSCKKVFLRSKFNPNGAGTIYFNVGGAATSNSFPLENGDIFPFEIPISNTNLISVICPTNNATLCIAAF